MVLWCLFAGRVQAWATADGHLPRQSVLFELVSRGRRPELTELRQDCPECLMHLMKLCWDADRSLRPSAEYAAQVIGDALLVVSSPSFSIFCSRVPLRRPVQSPDVPVMTVGDVASHSARLAARRTFPDAQLAAGPSLRLATADLAFLLPPPARLTMTEPASAAVVSLEPTLSVAAGPVHIASSAIDAGSASLLLQDPKALSSTSRAVITTAEAAVCLPAAKAPQ